MKSSPGAFLKLAWLGPPALEYDGAPLHLEMRKTLAILAYLSLAAHRPTRETLATMFWTDCDQQHALLSLRRSLHSLAHSLPAGLVESDRESIGLQSTDRLQVDVIEFRASLPASNDSLQLSDMPASGKIDSLEQAARLYKGDFLEGFTLKDCPEFDGWQRYQRESLRSEFALLLEKLIGCLQARSELEKAVVYARRWVALDPLNEAAQRKLITLYNLSGQRSAALLQYQDLASLLDGELHQAPQAETLALYQTILANGEPGNAKSAPAQRVTRAPEPEPLIKTKLYIPPVRKNQVIRLPLLEVLDAGMQRSLVLLSAPAGFGKTSLLASWAAHTDLPIAWYSLDEGDNDPVRFVAYLIAALDSLLPHGIADKLQVFTQSLQPSIQSTLIQLINALSGESEPFVLILDDYQAVQSVEVHKALGFLVDHMPSAMHLVIATRSDPPVSLARLRARDQLVEIRMSDLRFSFEEAGGFLNLSMGLPVSTADIRLLESRTEGWIAGLQMAALAIRKLITQDAVKEAGENNGNTVSRFIQSFSGSNRYILDYLSEEVLNRCPQSIRNFLLQTCLLEKLSGPLCDAVMQQAGSQETLEWLEKENLFLEPMDNERKWYRLHPIFGEILRIKLKETGYQGSESGGVRLPSPEEINRRAAIWFEENLLLEEAVHHYTAAGDFENAAALIETQAHGMFFKTGQSYTLLQWISALPVDFVRPRSRLNIARAWALISQSRFKESSEALGLARQAVTDHTIAQADSILGEIALVEGALAELSTRDVAVMRSQGLFAWQKLPPEARMLRGLAAWLLGASYLYDGDVKNAEEYFRNAIRLCRESGNIFVSLLAVVDLCNTLREQGRFRDAYQQLMQIEKEMTGEGLPANPGLGYIYNGIGQVLFAWNQLDEAERYLKLGIEVASQDIPGEILIFGLSSLAYLKLVQGQVNEAQSLAEECLQKAQAYPLPYVPAIVRASMVRFWIRIGDRERIDDWLAGCGRTPDDPVQYSSETEYIALAKALIWKGRGADALKVLDRLSELARRQGRYGKLVHIQLLQAIAFILGNQPELELDALEKSIAIAQPEGLIRPYVDEGQPMEKLLKLGAGCGIWQPPSVAEFVDRLLTALQQDRLQVTGSAAVVTDGKPPK